MGSAFAATGGEQNVVINQVASGDNSTLAAVTSKKLRLLSLAVTAAGTVSLTLGSDLAGSFVAKSGAMLLVANELFILPLNDAGWFDTDAGKAANFFTSAGISIQGVAKFQVIN